MPGIGLARSKTTVNDILSDLIWDFNIDVIEVSGSVTERRNQVLEHLSQI